MRFLLIPRLGLVLESVLIEVEDSWLFTPNRKGKDSYAIERHFGIRAMPI